MWGSGAGIWFFGGNFRSYQELIVPCQGILGVGHRGAFSGCVVDMFFGQKGLPEFGGIGKPYQDLGDA